MAKEERKKKSIITTYKPKVPYSTAPFCERSKGEMRKFTDIFKQLKINLPRCDVLLQMTKYAKYLTQMLSRKKKIVKVSIVTLSKEFLAILIYKEKLP